MGTLRRQKLEIQGVLKSEQELGGKVRSGMEYVYQVEESRKQMAIRHTISRHDRNPAWLKYWLQQSFLGGLVVEISCLKMTKQL